MATQTMDVKPFQLSNGLRFSGGRLSDKLLYLDTNRPAAELAPLSLTHADQAALYFAGLCDKYSIETGLDKSSKAACRTHYEAVHDDDKGNWNNDAVLYDTKLEDLGLHLLPGMTVQEGSIAVPWIVMPEWEHKNGIWIPKMGRNSKAVLAVLPPNGYGLIYLRDPNTGWVLQTRQSRAEAEKLVAGAFAKYVSDSKAADLAREEVSYSYRRAEGNGKSAVFRGFGTGDGGPFYEFAAWGGGYWDPGLGAFSLK